MRATRYSNGHDRREHLAPWFRSRARMNCRPSFSEARLCQTPLRNHLNDAAEVARIQTELITSAVAFAGSLCAKLV